MRGWVHSFRQGVDNGDEFSFAPTGTCPVAEWGDLNPELLFSHTSTGGDTAPLHSLKGSLLCFGSARS